MVFVSDNKYGQKGIRSGPNLGEKRNAKKTPVIDCQFTASDQLPGVYACLAEISWSVERYRHPRIAIMHRRSHLNVKLTPFTFFIPVFIRRPFHLCSFIFTFLKS